MAAADDTLSAELDAIRDRHWHSFAPGAARARLIEAAEDVPRLLTAVDAVLAPHQPGPFTIIGKLCKRHESHRYFSITRTEAAGVRDCADCTASLYTSCAGCGQYVSLDSCPVRSPILAALTGKEHDHG